MTELVLIRHGETEMNRELRFQGHVDCALNAIGLEQARRLAVRMAGEPADAVYASDLLRAQQTVQPIAAMLALQPVTEAGLREQSFGRVDGMRVEDIKEQHPECWEGWLRFEQDYCMPEGESTRQFHARVMAAVQRLVAAHPRQKLVVVTHGGVLDMIYRTALSLGLDGPRQSEIPNAGLNRIRVRDTGIEILDWADTRHLADLPPQPVYDQAKLVAAPNPSAA
ncbi:MAG: histidine phosphatase family protein [Ramlibacter sp.]|jgi:probable phosphoglycerate mutase|uniref:histidine phosphatase family protein n=1 Tax=Ramlibacter sp. TaxID=1917967 RepID=UPI002633066F|nr:histidine phosphatase family protein [Ramlibacter sp.]MDB5752973.1 histidine phosphatase family protein [Ramlibacter sp.]